jgi:hypothetical protein
VLLAEQVLRDVASRSRFARRHAAALANAVLAALAENAHQGPHSHALTGQAVALAEPDESPASATPGASVGAPGLARGPVAVAMAELARAAVAEPAVVASLLAVVARR